MCFHIDSGQPAVNQPPTSCQLAAKQLVGYHYKTRYNIIYSIILLHNLRTERVGLNQIATVFNPHYDQFINIEGYDRIARYYDYEFNE